MFKSFLRFAGAYSTMLSKNDIKFIRSLNLGKNRISSGLFVAEGCKLIQELLLSGLECSAIYSTDSSLFSLSDPVSEITARELKQISFLVNPKDSLALFRIPAEEEINPDLIKNDLTLLCDNIQDPGNMGTIIRIADWFGIKQIICSEDTADVFSPKVVQATMASIGRVKVFYRNPEVWIKENARGVPVMASSLSGKSPYEHKIPKNGLLILGNEARGISPELLKLSDYQIRIPGYGNAESLNVAVAAGILCYEIRSPR